MDHTLWTAQVESFDQFKAYQEHLGRNDRADVEREFAPKDRESTLVPGYCGLCRIDTEFLVDYQYSASSSDDLPLPNYRERLLCTHCHLNMRMRGTLHFFRDRLKEDGREAIYATEQVGPLFRSLSDEHRTVIGSEFLTDGTGAGEVNQSGIRHEDIVNLSFDSASLDYVLSFDVIEHVEDYRRGLREFYRCLRPGGSCLLTAPFDLGAESHLERARTVDGRLEHLLPPEYHGDPLDGSGILCFRTFGWQLLDDLRDVGFRSVVNHFYWSRSLGYFGGMPSLIVATK
jgi:hypothetical protein